MLIEKKAELNITNGFGTPPLAVATLIGNYEIEVFLLNSGSKINTRKNPALSFAILNNQVDCVELLLDKKASLDVFC